MLKLPFVLALCVATSAFAAEEGKPLADAGTVTCDYSPPAGSQSQWVKSGAGFSASVEVQTSITGSGNNRHCVTSWKLHVHGKDGNEQVITVGQRDDIPNDNEWIQENSFQIDGWSNDGNILVTSQIQVQGDWDETTPILFDFTTKRYSRVDLYPLFKAMIPADCYVLYRVLGVSNDGTVSISAFSTDDDRDAGTPQCFADSRWKLDARNGTILRVAPIRVKRELSPIKRRKNLKSYLREAVKSLPRAADIIFSSTGQTL